MHMCTCVYMHAYVYMCICMHVCIYINLLVFTVATCKKIFVFVSALLTSSTSLFKILLPLCTGTLKFSFQHRLQLKQ